MGCMLRTGPATKNMQARIAAFLVPMLMGRVFLPSSESMSSMSLEISLPMETSVAINATMRLSVKLPTTAPPRRNIIPVMTAMVRFPTKPLCFRQVSYATIRIQAMITMAMHSMSRVRNDTSTDPKSITRPAYNAFFLSILPEGIGRSGCAVLSIS